MEQKLDAQARDASGKGGARKVRAAGRVPAVVYGHGADPLHVSVDSRELFHVLHTDAGANVLVDLQLDGQTILTMPREIQRDLLRGRFVHVDFLRIARDETITVDVPVHLIGESRGVKEGGVLEHHLWNIQLECLPTNVPTAIEADISEIGMNESLKVSQLTLPEGVTLLTSEDETVVSVVPPQVLRVEEEEAAAEEEAAEGEAAAEGATGEEAAEHAEADTGSSEG
jgi:large subunit ribosomal protein L25